MVYHVFPSSAPKPTREGSRGSRGYYTRAQLSEAIKAVVKRNMSIANASTRYKIPRATLQKRVSMVREEHREAERIKCMGVEWNDTINAGGIDRLNRPGPSAAIKNEGSVIASGVNTLQSGPHLLPLFSDDPYSQGVAEECEVTTAPSTSHTMPRAVPLTKRIVPRKVEDIPSTHHMIPAGFEEKRGDLNLNSRLLPHTQPQRVSGTAVNRIVIRDTRGEIVKQFVLAERDASRDGLIPAGRIPNEEENGMWEEGEAPQQFIDSDEYEGNVNVE